MQVTRRVDGVFLKPVTFIFQLKKKKKKVVCYRGVNEIISNWFALQDEDSEFTLAADFEIGHFFRERIVPRAVLYFTGEAIEDDDNVCMPISILFISHHVSRSCPSYFSD